MSITKGLGNQKHNNRTQKETTKNVNHDLTFLNVTLLDENIRNVYHELFDPSLEKYNAKQKRSDRKIKDYYSKIANSKQEKLFHELVVSIGNIDNVPFSVGNKRGLETRVSNDKAIEQMGYRNWTDWKDRQFETLEKICYGHGIERVSMDNHSRHMSVESYKKEQRMIENLQNSLEHTLKTQNLPVTEQIEPHVNKKNRSIQRIFSPSGA